MLSVMAGHSLRVDALTIFKSPDRYPYSILSQIASPFRPGLREILVL